MSLDQLESRIGHHFQSPELIVMALTHRSFSADNNERLEFMGDAILSHVISEDLFNRFPEAREGQMSRIRAQLVKGVTLAEIAREFDVGPHLRLGIGEKKNGGSERESILADSVEAIIGAIHLDAGFETAKVCILSWFSSRLDALSLDQKVKDPKSRLQELLQSRHLPLPDYHVVEVSGAEHQQQFVMGCRIEKQGLETKGNGSNRKKAEQQAAEQMLKLLEPDNTVGVKP